MLLFNLLIYALLSAFTAISIITPLVIVALSPIRLVLSLLFSKRFGVLILSNV